MSAAAPSIASAMVSAATASSNESWSGISPLSVAGRLDFRPILPITAAAAAVT